jgi:hypothetical protein
MAMRDVVSAILIAGGLEVTFFILLIVMVRLEPEEPRSAEPHSRRSKPSLGTIRNVSDDDERLRAA